MTINLNFKPLNELNLYDLTAIVYVIAAVLALMTYNYFIPFTLASAVLIVLAWKAKKVNALIQNAAVLVFSLVCWFD